MGARAHDLLVEACHEHAARADRMHVIGIGRGLKPNILHRWAFGIFEFGNELPALAKRQGQVAQIGHQRAFSRVECAECDLKGVALVLKELGAVLKAARRKHCVR